MLLEKVEDVEVHGCPTVAHLLFVDAGEDFSRLGCMLLGACLAPHQQLHVVIGASLQKLVNSMSRGLQQQRILVRLLTLLGSL